MMRVSGKSVYKGIVSGKILILSNKDQKVRRYKITNPAAEIDRLKLACKETGKQLGQLYHKAVKEVGEASAAIFEVHQMMLEDEDYQDAISNMIQQDKNDEHSCADWSSD